MKKEKKNKRSYEIIFSQKLGRSESLEENNNVRWMIFKIK